MTEKTTNDETKKKPDYKGFVEAAGWVDDEGNITLKLGFIKLHKTH